MKPVNDPLLKWRQPTAPEKAWIAQIWGAEEKINRPLIKGSFFRYFGIFLIAVGVASVLRDGADIASVVVTLMVAVLFIFLAGIYNYAYKLHEQRMASFEQGNYLVAEAYSTVIRRGTSRRFHTGRTNVSLPSGGCAEDLRMPFICADPLARQNIHAVPLLLIQVPGDETTLTIPVKQ